MATKLQVLNSIAKLKIRYLSYVKYHSTILRKFRSSPVVKMKVLYSCAELCSAVRPPMKLSAQTTSCEQEFE